MPSIRPELLDELLKDHQKPEDLLGQDGLLQQLTKALVEGALDGELTHHLGYEKYDPAGDNSDNSRNGTTPGRLFMFAREVKEIDSVWKESRALEEKFQSGTQLTTEFCAT